MGCKAIADKDEKSNIWNNNSNSHQPNQKPGNKPLKIPNTDYLYYRTELKKWKQNSQQVHSDKYFECKLQIVITKNSEMSILSKYLYFKQDGTFISKTINTEDNSITEFKGKLTKTGDFEFSRKIELDTYWYKAQFPLDDFNSMDTNPWSIQGQIYKNGNIDKTSTFAIVFPKSIFRIEYVNKENNKVAHNIHMSMKNNIFSGISYNDRGFAIWFGFEKEGNKVKIIEQYICDSNKDDRDNSCWVFEGICGKINGYKIEGNVKNERLGINSVFKIKIIHSKKKI